MRAFTDNAGRKWTVAINVDAIKRVRGLLDIDLLEMVEGTLVEKLMRDPVLLCDVLYVVCKPEADEKGVSDEEFGRAMAGDVIEQATKALLEELVDNSPSPKERANLQRILTATWEAIDRTRDVMTGKLDKDALERIGTLAVARAEAQMAEALEAAGISSGSVPESLESIQAP